jgi:lipopolysaccharide heptosyltransferase II
VARYRLPVPAAPPEPQRLVVVRLGAIGDVVNALVFASAVKRVRPGVHLAWVVHGLARPLVEGHPDVDHVHVFERGSGLAGWRRLALELRAQRYDLAVDLQRICKSALVARLSGAPRVLGYDRGRAKEWSWLLASERIPPGPPHEHMVEQYRAFARALGCDAPVEHRLPNDPEAAAWAADRVAAFGGAPVLVNPGASKPRNRWPAERFAPFVGELAQRLASRGTPLAVVGGPGDRELAAPLLAAAPTAHDLVGRTSLRQLTALLARARLLVTGDTGPMHLAVAVGTPTVALFGPADPRRTGPYGGSTDPAARHTIVQAPGGDMDALQPAEVAARVWAKLAPGD